MKFLSLFSGIGGFDLGFARTGMTPVAACEYDKHCRNVLQRHFPGVEIHNDVRELNGAAYSGIDLICGGFPCQDLSVAGRRAGLAGKRSGLWWQMRRICREAGPRWIVIENVPGLLSSNAGRDFAVILRGLARCGYGLCWRILDAQYFGVAQRRRRVFVVASLGGFRGRCAQVLFESEGGSRDIETIREKRQDVAGTITGGFEGAGGGNRPGMNTDSAAYSLIASTIGQRMRGQDDSCANNLIASTVHSDYGNGSPRGDGADNKVVGTPRAKEPGFGGVAADTTHILPSHSPSLVASGGIKAPDTKAYIDNGAGVRRLTPVEDTQRIVNTLRANAGAPKHAADNSKLVVDTLPQQGYTNLGGISHASTQERDARTILRLLRQKVGEKAFAEWGLRILDSLQQAEILQPSLYGGRIRCEASEERSELGNGTSPRPQTGETGKLREMWCSECLRRASQEWRLSGQQAGELGAYLSQLSQQGASQSEALCDLWEASEGLGILRQALSKIQEVWRSTDSQSEPARPAYGVRRLTPTEAERLQGFPDGWTDLPQADSIRYRQLGNAVAVPVIEWIGRRIMEVEEKELTP